jgi:hypothetical protein
MYKFRPLVLNQLSHIIRHFWEALRLKQELVQPFEILLHHDVVGDNSRCIDMLFQCRCLCFLAAESQLSSPIRLNEEQLRHRSVPARCGRASSQIARLLDRSAFAGDQRAAG